MTIYNQKYGFVYIWRDKKKNMYYIGSHWGTEDDGYICSSNWMYKTYKRRPSDFKRRILKRIYTNRVDLLIEEDRYLGMIKHNELAKSCNKDTIRYYNVFGTVKFPWHATQEGIDTVGPKISKANKGKNTGPRPPEVGQNISKAKKEKFAKKEAELGYKFDPEHAAKLREANKGRKHTEEWKQDNSVRMTKQWNDGTRKRAEPKMSMTPEEQAELSSKRLKGLWSDPDWAAKQSERLKEGARSRPPRSDESKAKARDSQLGMPKLGNRTTYRITFMTGEVIEHTGLKSLVEQYSVPASTVGGAIREQKSLPRYNIMSIEKVN
jgi:hypothetical protein